jgi:HlyD family secretion protein
MSKQVSKRKRIVIIIVVVLALALVIAAATMAQNKAGSASKDAVYVYVTSIAQEPIESVLYTKGTIKANQSAQVFSEYSGEVSEVFVESGTQVKAGDEILKLNTDTLEEQIRDAALQVEIAKINYNTSFNKSGLQSSVTNAELAYENAKKTYDNTKTLYDAGAASAQELDSAQFALDQAKASYNAAQAALNESGSNSSLSALQLQAAENAYQDLLNRKEAYTIKAPIDGTVTAISAEQYDLISPGVQVASIETVNDLKVVTYIGEYDVNKLAVGMPAEISGYAVGDRVYDASIESIGSTATAQSTGQSTEKSVEVVLSLGGGTDFKPNFTADVKIKYDSSDDALVIPYEALKTVDGNDFIYAVESGKAVKKEVEIGVQGEIKLEVKSPELKAGDQIVLNPPSELEDGSTIEIIEER